jgi:hypothetical protein
MIHYRALFSDLLGEPANAEPGSAATEPEQATAAVHAAPKNGDAPVAGPQPAMAAGDPVTAADTSQQVNRSDTEELTK